eukprot:2916809-Ditylum_brightwellii.AAC.1
MAEELDNDGESVMIEVTRIQLSQEKQTEDEDDDKTGKDANKMQDTVNERLMRYQQTLNLIKCSYKAHGLCVAPKLLPIPCQMLGCKNKLPDISGEESTKKEKAKKEKAKKEKAKQDFQKGRAN